MPPPGQESLDEQGRGRAPVNLNESTHSIHPPARRPYMNPGAIEEAFENSSNASEPPYENVKQKQLYNKIKKEHQQQQQQPPPQPAPRNSTIQRQSQPLKAASPQQSPNEQSSGKHSRQSSRPQQSPNNEDDRHSRQASRHSVDLAVVGARHSRQASRNSMDALPPLPKEAQLQQTRHEPEPSTSGGPHTPAAVDSSPVPPYMPMQTSQSQRAMEKKLNKKKEKEGCKQQ